MTEIINQLGGRIDVILLIILIGLFFLLSSLISNKVWRITVSFLLSLFTSLQIVSLYTTQNFVSYQFYVHFNLRGITGMWKLFIPQLIFLSFIFLLLLTVYYYSHSLSKWFFQLLKRWDQNIPKVVVISIITLFSLFLFTKGYFASDTKTLIDHFITKETNLKEVLRQTKLDNYVTPDLIEAKQGKNIIILSLESLERVFLEGKYSLLTPNLTQLKNTWNYVDLEQNEGSGWTSGSLYTYLTGFPAFFGVHGNSIFQTAYHSEISSISHVLEKANYETFYLNGNTDHSGVKEMLHAFSFDRIIDDKNIRPTGFESVYGLRDKDLFEIAKKEVADLHNRENPFAFFISTTDTHFPNGIYDSRMETVISKKNSDLEFMVSALDYLIGDFIQFLDSENLLENTAIYIFPDHLKHGNPSPFDGLGKRGLYLISNSSLESNSESSARYQIDLPRIILKGAQVEHNMRFLSDYIEGDKNEYIVKNIRSITEINTNGLLRTGATPFATKAESENYMRYKKDTSRYIAHAGGMIDEHIYTNSKEALDLSYSKGFRLFELDILTTKDGKFVAAHDWEMWAEKTNFEGELPPTLEEFMNFKLHNEYNSLDMDGINEWFSIHEDAILITDKINQPKEFSQQFIDKNRLMMELFDMEAVKVGINEGILSSMPSQSVINTIDKSQVSSLAQLGIKHIAISRRFIQNNKELLDCFQKNNIRAYAFHLNSDSGIDEDYVTKYEMDYIHGVYADDWSFK